MMTKLIIATTIAIFFASCEMNAIKGSGNVTNENRPVNGDFKSIEASDGLEVIVEQAAQQTITVEADDNLQKHIITTIDNGVLVIKCKYNSYHNVTKKITVKLPVIEVIEVSKGATLKTVNTMKSNAITLRSSSGADMKVSIEVEKAICEASSGSHIDIDGKAIELETKSSSGSSIDADQLLSNDITAKASSGSTIEVRPLVSLNAKASSGGNINYHNDPKTVTKDTGSGGSINKQ